MRSTTFPPSPLRAYRAGQGFSQAELAEVTGLSRETISRLEQGARPQLATAHAIAAALGVPIGAIFPIQDESPTCVAGSANRPAGEGRHDRG